MKLYIIIIIIVLILNILKLFKNHYEKKNLQIIETDEKDIIKDTEKVLIDEEIDLGGAPQIISNINQL